MLNKLLFLVSIVFLSSCGTKSHQKLSQAEYDSLSVEQKRSVEFALEGLDLYDPELEVTLFASEPMMTNPTNMDIDDKGRVWICEANNYRNKLNPRNPYNSKGDRILIMEDTDGDGVADSSKVFYQGEDINAALGIAVLGNRVIVSCSPNVFVFTDEDGDDVPDKKEILFKGIGGEQHDHGMHAFTFGPDGKLYFNYGNAGKGMLTKNGDPLLDDLGNPINAEGKPYREGMVYRSDLDGSNVEILAWNFRNNYELTVDSFGRMWQSDNDDDGNRGTRINFVMDYGNYGFKDEITGSDWRTRRVNMEDSIYHQHWHLNDPGVVPNLVQTYAGSPTGIAIYEGKLLPQKYHNQVLHTDAGPNVLRAYPVQKDGAGFSAEILPILSGNQRDKWFRPSDVTVAPDGSIFIADWYDPGVGGHAMGDLEKGRVYRIAPRNHKYKVQRPNYANVNDCIEALQSPNTATRYKAFVALESMGEKAKGALEELYNNEDIRMKARAFWLLAKLDKKFIDLAAQDKNEDMKVAAIKAARIHNYLSTDFLVPLAGDQSAQVRREVAIAIRHKDFKDVWLTLAKSYDANDRWYLEVLGIAADQKWDEYLPAYITEVGNKWISNTAAQHIIWRSRADVTPAYLAQLIDNSTGNEQLRYYRALDFQKQEAKNEILLARLEKSSDLKEEIVIFRQIDPRAGRINAETVRKAENLLARITDDADYLEIVKKYKIKSQKDKLLEIITTSEDVRLITEAAGIFIDFYGMTKVKELSLSNDKNISLKAIERFGVIDNEPMTNLLISIWQNPKYVPDKREMAMEAMNGWDSEIVLWQLVQEGKVPEDVMPIAQNHLLRTWHSDIRVKASDFFGGVEETNVDVGKLMAIKGNAAKGKEILSLYCLTCHKVNGEGIDFGPGLSQIGAKLSKDGLYNAILNPSEGMGFGYETQLIKFNNGDEVSCIVTSKTENEVFVKMLGQGEQSAFQRKDIVSIEQQETSLMPKFPLKENELVDLVTYLGTLK